MTVLRVCQVDDHPARHTSEYARDTSIKNNDTASAPLLGDHSVSDPPDPISNSAVKPDSANGTVAQAPEE